MSTDFLWETKYAPKNVADIILPKRLSTPLQKIAETGNVPHMLLCGTPGTGKTTVANVLTKQIGADTLFINASKEGNMDTLRNRIERFATTTSLGDSTYKVVILDEADSPTSTAFQPALRAFMTQFGEQCRFILTANHQTKIIEAIISRCGVYDFSANKQELTTMSGAFFKRCMEILEGEGVDYNQSVVARLIKSKAPDWRRILGDLQKASMAGPIVEDTIFRADISYDELFTFLKTKNFGKMRTWVAEKGGNDTASIFRGIYDRMNKNVKEESIPALVLILADYGYKSAFVADQEINMVAAFTEIMANVDFK
jgi:DNA polymerase III delta prime subunit